jgi:AmmeMemoRadiSam system radical SAM enzyme/AmmeMemoRadiSam system protein B/AmmeMemoRadiSam system protein A
MTRIVEPPAQPTAVPEGVFRGGWWHSDDEHSGRIVCDLCPRACSLKPGDRGFCFVRENRDGEMLLTTYGRSTGFCIDPIEKKPLNHFLPGTSVLSFGTAGCNLGCKFCQNWDISKSREIARLSESAAPETIAEAARQLGCHSVAYTYNDPVIWAEYAIDTARACREVGVKNVAVTAGYIMPEVRRPFFDAMDAANVDLKAFTEDFYRKITYSHLEPVLDTLRWLKHESDVWFEITNLIIPTANDSPDEIRSMCDWILEAIGDETPIHFTAFHPDFRMKDVPNTPHEKLLEAYDIARGQGMKYVYVGNVFDARHDSTYCPGCGKLVIERNWHELGQYHLRGDACGHCGYRIAGRFLDQPGTWGRRRQPVRIGQFAAPRAPVPSSASKQEERSDPASSKPPSRAERDETMTTPPASLPESAAEELERTPTLDDAQKRLIHTSACRLVAAEVTRLPAKLDDDALALAAGQKVSGAFVTLKRQGRLRGCCGTFGQPMELLSALTSAATRTATADVRLPPVSPAELPHLDLSVSLLHTFRSLPPQVKRRRAAVEIGRHGLHVARGDKAGLLLPVVAVENDLDAEQFLRQVCRKAGLPTTAWEDPTARLTTFEVQYVDGPFNSDVCREFTGAPRVLFNEEQMQLLTAHCRRNLLAQLRGATPNYYLAEVADASAPGVVVTVQLPQAPPTHLVKFAMRPGVPVQSSLLALTEAAAAGLRGAGLTSGYDSLHVGVSVLHDTAMHGTVAEPDLAGIDPAGRAVLVVENNKSAWVYDPQKSAAELVEQAAREACVAAPHLAGVYSLAVHSSEPSLSLTTAPRPREGQGVRPPGVAGAFYPADAHELSKMVDECLAGEPCEPQPWPALMTPHAGLVYSGRVAGQTFRRAAIADTVLVIGPKHTRLGVEWAVTPHETWALPGGDMACDPAFARRLAEGIDGLQLDAAAHQNEHAIEVELPLIRRLNPGAKVVGIAIGADDLPRCRAFAKQLAEVLRREASMPLLVISSDMNHFATDEENRRLDEMAIAAMETLDAERLYETVMRHQISMCGVLPAVIVMETLRELGRLRKCERVAYATSADVSGDTSRVVGYAGMLLGS